MMMVMSCQRTAGLFSSCNTEAMCRLSWARASAWTSSSSWDTSFFPKNLWKADTHTHTHTQCQKYPQIITEEASVNNHHAQIKEVEDLFHSTWRHILINGSICLNLFSVALSRAEFFFSSFWHVICILTSNYSHLSGFFGLHNNMGNAVVQVRHQ